MKVLYSEKINAFGGLNFVHEHLQQIGIDNILQENLPFLAPQSKYCWNDIFSSLLSIYYCGGNRIEDAKLILEKHFSNNPFFKLCSPDTILKRLKSLQVLNKTCKTPRGAVEHDYNHNEVLCRLNIELLKSLGVFAEHEVVLD